MGCCNKLHKEEGSNQRERKQAEEGNEGTIF